MRSIHDPLYGKGQPVERNAYFYDNHYRRFIVLEELVQSLEQCGYRVECAKEQTGFAPYGNDNPPLSGWWLYGHRGGPCPDTGGVP